MYEGLNGYYPAILEQDSSFFETDDDMDIDFEDDEDDDE